MDGYFGRHDDGWRHVGKYAPKTPKSGVSSQFRNVKIYITVSLEVLLRPTTDLRNELRPVKTLRGWSAVTPKQVQHGWRPTSWKSTWRYISAAGGPIWLKFGSRMQNKMPIMVMWSKSKPEVEFHYDGRLFFQTGSTYISAMDWVIPTKFGLQINFLKSTTSPTLTPEVKLCHVPPSWNTIWHNSVVPWWSDFLWNSVGYFNAKRNSRDNDVV